MGNFLVSTTLESSITIVKCFIRLTTGTSKNKTFLAQLTGPLRMARCRSQSSALICTCWMVQFHWNFCWPKLHILTVDRISYRTIMLIDQAGHKLGTTTRTPTNETMHLANKLSVKMLDGLVIYWQEIHMILKNKCILVNSQNGFGQRTVQWHLDPTLNVSNFFS